MTFVKTPHHFLLSSLCLSLVALLGLPVALTHAQAPAGKQVANLIPNGDFEQSSIQQTLWYGVDSEGYLAGAKGNSQVLAKTGGLGSMAMPLSVTMADINGDHLPDLVTADPAGYLRAYINEGTVAEPKFSRCEMIPFFLTRYVNAANDRDVYKYGELERRSAQRINLYDWGHRGIYDLLIGTYAGEVYFFPNSGSASSPSFRQPVNNNDGELITAPGGALWGTLFSPIAYDWDKGGRPDLLIGEGSYSANAVHLLLNRGTAQKPEFGDTRYYLAYGDGREQLVPTVADYNGDGEPDLLIADREGTVGAYVKPADWKPGDELPFSSYLTFGTLKNFGGPVTICAGDYNGDGLFDLLVGKNNGRIAVAINKGTKEQPQFDTPVEIKGDPEAGRNPVNIPGSWQCDAGTGKGNIYGYFSVVGPEDKHAAPPDHSRVLKAAYFPSPNKVFKLPDLAIPGLSPGSGILNTGNHGVGFRPLWERNIWTPSRTFMLHISPSAPLKAGSSYTISFNVKGGGLKEGHWVLGYGGHKENAPAQVERGERGSAKVTRDITTEMNTDTGGNFTVASSWVNISKSFTVRFKDPKLKDLPATTTAGLEISFQLAPYDGVFYLDDVQLIEKK